MGQREVLTVHAFFRPVMFVLRQDRNTLESGCESSLRGLEKKM